MTHAVHEQPVLLEPSTWYLLMRIELLGARVAAAVARRRAADPDPDDAFRGLYVSDEQVDRLLAGGDLTLDAPDVDGEIAQVEDEADHLEDEGFELRLRSLTRVLGLDAVDVDLLLVALAPDVEPRFERLYSYLQDDVTRRRPGPALALELAAGAAGALVQRARLGPRGRLRAGLVLDVEDADHPFLTRSLRVPDRVSAHLLGDDAPDPVVARVLGDPPPMPVDERAEITLAVASGAPVVYVRDTSGAGTAAAAGACDACGRRALVADLARVGAQEDAGAAVAAVAIEAVLRGAAVVAGPVDAIERRPEVLRALTDLPVPVVLVGRRQWDASWAAAPPLTVESPPFTASERASLWSGVLDGSVPGVDAAAATAQFRLTPDQIAGAALAARRRAAVAARPVTADDLRHGARLQSSSGLDRLATRIEPRARWDDLVISEKVEASLRDLAARARHRERVVTEWEMGGGAARRRGIVALFTGPSGTGKTLSSEVLAHDLGLDLYVVDLSSVVDKYVGETEKNIDRIFTEADRVNAVLLFDEADARFGKRSGVEAANDRYANIEVSYLLQRMESFDGIAILTSNLRGNLDEAFARRLDAIVELPAPDRAARLRLWDVNLPPALPRADDLDLAFLARFKLSGGAVRNACVAAAFRAAAGERPVEMGDLVRGVAQEYAKLGHMCTEAEFGAYYSLVSGHSN